MTSGKKEKTIDTFRSGFNCSQAVLSSFSPDLGLEKETALKIACGFGGGIARLQETCGAVTGAVMVLGLKYGNYNEDVKQAKEKTYELVRQFTDKFKKRNGSLVCRELIKYDLNNEEEHRKAKEENVFSTICEKCLEDSVTILEHIISKE